MSQPIEETETRQAEALKKWATIGYALQAVSFIVGISYIAALIVAYLKLPEARGTWLESHYLWQIRTFWYSLLWGVLGGISLMWLAGYMILIADMIWMVYRIVVGWVRLSENKSAYIQSPPVGGS
ncbi:MAG: membrane protein [Methylohalobius crimeensis]